VPRAQGLPAALGAEPSVVRGVQAGVAAYVLWGLLTIYWKQLSAFDAVELIGWRVAMAAVVMMVVVTVRGRWPVLRTAFRSPRLVGRLAMAGVLLAVNWTMYVYAVVSDQIIETALGYFLAPLGTITLGVVVFGERLSPAKRFGVACAVAAVIVLTVSAGRLPLIAIVIAASWSLYGLAKRTVSLPPIESLTGETLVLLGPAVAVIAWGTTRSDGIPATAVGGDWLFLIGTGLATAVPLLLFSVAARSVPFTVLGPLNYLVPLINFVLGWVVYDEPVPLVRFLGFLLIWLALVAVTVDTLRSARRPRPVPAVPLP
jgi:chloramphenicol-sensitive protein RarD